MVLKSCKAEQCHQPWAVLHPQGDVRTLRDALHSKFDVFYNEQPRVGFSACELGYIVGSEGPQTGNAFGVVEEPSGYTELRSQPGRKPSFEYSGHWSWWV